MASEVCYRQPLEFIGEQSSQVVWTLLGKRSCRYHLPESCRLTERRNMPALPSPLSGFNLHCSPWPYSDSWIFELDAPPIKRSKVVSYTLRNIAPRPLALSSSRKSSSREISSSFVSRTGDVVDDSDRRDVSIDRDDRIERKRVSDEKRIDAEASKCERGLGAEGWKFRVVASSRCKSPSRLASDVISTIDFNGDGNFFATGGIARKIRICSYLKMVGDNDDRHGSLHENTDSDDDDDDKMMSSRRKRISHVRDHVYASAGEICTPGKLSSVKWRPDGSEVIGCGDYDGVVMEWSVEYKHTVSERYEHSGQRVWSLDYSMLTPTLSASSSADGTVRVWSRGIDKSVFVLRPDSGNSVCSAEFSPVADHVIAVASADANIYLYDLRKSESSLLKLSSHDRAVSYVRFLGKDKLVSASIDSTLKLWDISAPLREVEANDGQSFMRAGVFNHGGARLLRTFSAHTNVRHFVGLSLHRGASVMACGSETDEVFVYRNSTSVPLLNHKFPGKCFDYNISMGSGNSYVGAVCWREQGDKLSLVAANSEGIVQVLQAST